jgi:hypothetical protein
LIYLDTSVALAHLLAEDRHPPDELWRETLVASRLLEYELWNRIQARGLLGTHAEAAHLLIGRIALIELARPVLARALEPFLSPVRTLDALHLASLEFLRGEGQPVELASYDDRMLAAARRMKIPVSRFSKAV